MPKIQYEEINMRAKKRELIEQVNIVIADYQEQGYSLTLRQIYYQLVSRNFIENSEKSYKNIGNLISNGRLAGLIDWDAIEDRTRIHRVLNHFESPADILDTAAQSYRRDLWEGQPCHVEVWVEKDALIGIVEQAAQSMDCPCFSCRGFASQSSMWASARRFIEKAKQGRECILIYLGDHDPSGIAMTSDIAERMELFCAAVDVRRVALTMEQVAQYSPPPNPAKETDTRFAGYAKLYGAHSWELDALKPEILHGLITDSIKMNLDQEMYDAVFEQQEAERQQIKALQGYL